MTAAWGKKFFYECVPCVCLTFCTIFDFSVLYGIWVIDGCDESIIWTTI